MEPKFRIWNKEKKSWHKTELEFYGFQLLGECMLVCPPSISDLDKLVISQWLGISDFENKDVYHGDIYKNGESGLIGLLELQHLPGGLIVYCTELKDGRISNHCPFIDLDLTNFKVIDNIYENKKGIKFDE